MINFDFLKKTKKSLIIFFVFSMSWLFVSLAQAEISFGNSNGNIILIEYFSYNCPICRNYMPIIDYVAIKNPNIKIIQRVVPVAMPSLKIIDEAVLASFLQGKFPQFQRTILEAKLQGAIMPKEVIKLAQQSNLNIAQLLIDMNKPIVTKQLQENLKGFLKVYSKIHQTHVPVFVLYNKSNPNRKILMAGAQPLEKLQYAINLLSNNSTKNLTKNSVKNLTKSTKGDHYHASRA